MMYGTTLHLCAASWSLLLVGVSCSTLAPYEVALLPSGNGGNELSSPLSLWTVAASLTLGARDSTLKQLGDVFSIPTSDYEALRNYISEISKKLQSKDLDVSNDLYLFYDNNLTLTSSYVADVTEDLKATITALNFKEAAVAAKIANGIVKKKTNSSFTPFAEESLRSDILVSSMMRVNLNWKSQFDPRLTGQKHFYDENGKELGVVEMMFQQSVLPMIRHETLGDVLQLGYSGTDQYTMLVMKPRTGRKVKDVLNALPSVDLDNLLDRLGNSTKEVPTNQTLDVAVRMPRFNFASTQTLGEILKQMELTSLFDDADFSRMTKNNVSVSSAVWGAQVAVNEAGTKIDVGTDVNVDLPRVKTKENLVQRTFTAERPFVFMMLETLMKKVLFVGVVSEPILSNI